MNTKVVLKNYLKKEKLQSIIIEWNKSKYTGNYYLITFL